MKKLLSLILALAIIMTTIFTTLLIFAADTGAEGGYMHVSGRGNQNSGPRQYLGDALKASGDGTYQLSAWVRIPGNTAEKSVAIIIYTGAYPQISKKITNGEWTLLSGEISVSGSANIANNNGAYFRIQTGTDLNADNWDIDFDSVVLRKKTGDNTYGENLIQDSECELSPLSPWFGTSATLSNPVANDTALYGVQVEYKSDGNLMISKQNAINFCINGNKAEATVYNAGTEAITVGLQVRKTANWATIGGNNEWNTIAPGEAKTITTEIDAASAADDKFAILVANGAGKTGKLVLCNLTAEQTISLKDATKWNVNNSVAPTVVANPETAQPTPENTPQSTPQSTPQNTPQSTPVIPETQAEGGYMHVTGRGNQNSGPRQLLGDALNASGDGIYLFSAWVRFPGNTASKKVTIMIYPGAWPAATLEKTITDGEWTLVSGEVSITGTANFANNENIYFRIQTGTAQTDNWDIDFDSVVLKKKTGNTYGENLIQDSECELSPLSPWYGTSATLSNPVANDTSLYGVQVEYKSDGNLFISKKDQFNFCLNGNKAEVTVYNAGTESITLGLQIRGGANGFATLGGNNEWNTIAPGEAKTITTTIKEADVATANWAVLVANGAGKTGKIVLCNLTAEQTISLKDATKWNVNNSVAPTVVANPEITQPSPDTTPTTSPAPTTKTPDLKAEKGYITVTNRVNQNAGPRQFVGDALKASGDGTYYLSAWVKVPENSENKAVRIIVVAGGKYPQVEKVITNGEWTLISGEISITGTANIANNEGAYFRIQTGSALTDNWDLCFDGITLNKKNADGTYGNNILTNAEFNKEDPATWANDKNCKITFVDATEKIEIEKPTGVIITATEETETNHIITNTGIVSKNDIKDGKISKTFTIINQGEEAVKVTFSLQAEHTKEDGTKMWSAPEKGFTALIEPGDKQELTYTMDVNDDGTITLTGGDNDADYAPEKFFARFDILEADGNPKVLKGTKLVILNNNPDISFSAGAKDIIKVEVTYSKQYDTSDFIPVSAFVILPVIVAFAIVTKKRKEN